MKSLSLSLKSFIIFRCKDRYILSMTLRKIIVDILKCYVDEKLFSSKGFKALPFDIPHKGLRPIRNNAIKMMAVERNENNRAALSALSCPLDRNVDEELLI